MPFSEPSDHALITIYGDNASEALSQAVSLYLPDKDIRILAPQDKEMLLSAAQNSALVIIGLSSHTDPYLNLGRTLQEDLRISSDVIAFYLADDPPKAVDVLARGFDCFLTLKDAESIEFKQYLAAQIHKGARRLARHIKEDQYRRLSDALAIAPVSLIVFDKDKKAVFVSDHYFRAYPRIAPRLIRGLRVYDAFQMMAEQEGLKPNDERYERIQSFWYNLNGTVEFTLDDGRSYRLKAEKLSADQGTIVTGQNITGYIQTKDLPY